MPNGHGGVPYFGGPVVLAMMFAFLMWLPFAEGGWLAWTRFGVCMILAAAIGWRVAYYIHMYGADEYGGDTRRQTSISAPAADIGSRCRSTRQSRPPPDSLSCGGAACHRPSWTQ
jgi:hypothetical protein